MNISLLCEYMNNPVGLDMEKPGFSCYLDDNSVEIGAARFVVSDSKEAFSSIELFSEEMEDKILWDSGLLEMSSVNQVIYDGKKLSSGVTYYWKVFLSVSVGEKKEIISSETASFTMGLMPGDLWQASWIGGIQIDKSSYLYRKQWKNKKEVKSAAIFVASPCYNVVTVNGKRADTSVLNNVFADYDKSLYYATYDITKLLQTTDNAIGIMTGRGWNSLREAEDGIGWGDSLFSAQIRLEYIDGLIEWIYSDLDGWQYTTDGPIRYDSIYNGEIYDARMELPGWDEYGYDVSMFHDVVEREAPKGLLRSQMLEPIRVVKEMPIKEIISVGDGSYTIDFGKNSAGWVRIKMKGIRGESVSIKPAELINADGSVNPISLRNAHPLDTYIFKGEGVEIYEPRFTYHGFRYAQIFGLKEKPTEDMITGCFVRSDVSKIGSFHCDNDVVNAFYEAVCQTEESNLHGVPTDCPQRDERLGWLNDMTVRNEGALYNYKLYQLYAKWLRDIRDTQGKTTGAVTDTAPFLRYGFRPADPVSSSFLLLPWNLYLHYGDLRILQENYDANARWVEYLKRNSNDLIVRYSSMGDWAAPVGGTDHTSTGGGALSAITPQLLMSTGYLYYDCVIMEKMAKALHKQEDEKYYQNLAQQVKDAFSKEYYHSQEKYYATNSQASNVLPLYFGMTQSEDINEVLEHLCKDIMETNHGHLTTGNICTRYAIEVLFQNGKEDIAWHLLTQTEYPSWGFMLKNGATTMWERWEKVEDNDFLAAMASMNHPMNGGAVVSLHKYLAGICPDEEMPGYKNIIFRPIVPTNANFAEATIKTIRGNIMSSWHKEGKELVWNISVPSGCTASVYLPDFAQKSSEKMPLHVKAGNYTYYISM